MSDLLTPGDVHDKQFRTHRFIEGYDMDEVDDFLDQAADTILRLASALRERETEQCSR
jgi:DivIVA domain-containing protein